MKLQNIIMLSLILGVVTFVAIEAGRCCGKNKPAPKPSVIERIKDRVSNLIHGQKEPKDGVKKCNEDCKCDSDCICSNASGHKCSCSQQNVVIQQENNAETNQEENKESPTANQQAKEETKDLHNVAEIAPEVVVRITGEISQKVENEATEQVRADEMQDVVEGAEEINPIV